jgi:hypothetical protein
VKRQQQEFEEVLEEDIKILTQQRKVMFSK